MKSILGLLTVLSSVVVFAQTPVPVSGGKGDGPCAEVHNACKAGGFEPRTHKATGKGMVIDCEEKILLGQPVAGVTMPSQAGIDSCKASRVAHGKKL